MSNFRRLIMTGMFRSVQDEILAPPPGYGRRGLAAAQSISKFFSSAAKAAVAQGVLISRFMGVAAPKRPQAAPVVVQAAPVLRAPRRLAYAV